MIKLGIISTEVFPWIIVHELEKYYICVSLDNTKSCNFVKSDIKVVELPNLQWNMR